MPAQTVLREVFGFDSFRPLQREVIASVLARRDTLAVMPTGGGKSLCYQLPALLFDGLTVVVSPLISLMQDQVRQLDAMGVACAVLNSSLAPQTYRANREAVASGRARLLYLAPETLFMERTLSLLSGVQVACLTIDEAHCISEWGHDFRPEYRRLVEVRERFPGAVCIGLTATATPRVQRDIVASLGFDEDARFVASFDRPNLALRVEDKDRPLEQLLRFLERVQGDSGIVYCTSRRRVEELAERLGKRGYSARPYHAGLHENVRRENQERFIRDDVDIIVATVAFGMGIDKPDVRFVAHYDLPRSVESYYQEIGRAGRDGLPADCLLLYGAADVGKIEFFISQKDDSEQRVARQQLDTMRGYAEATTCRRRPLLAYFGETLDDEHVCDACDNCLEPRADLADLTVPAQKYLSCVYRTGQRYGAAHIVAVLRGSKNQKLLGAGHQDLSTWGIGMEYDGAQWRQIGRLLLQQGLLSQDPEYFGLRLSANAAAVLRGEATVQGRAPLPARRARKARAERVRGSAARLDIDYPTALFERLRAERKALADEKGVPPYVVFADRTLIEMAAHQPGDEASLLALHGVGQVKLDRYGRIFLDAIERWQVEQAEPESASDPA